VKPGIPKFRKESHPERARNKTGPIFSHLLRRYFSDPGNLDVSPYSHSVGQYKETSENALDRFGPLET
jgi:hypothetical protein